MIIKTITIVMALSINKFLEKIHFMRFFEVVNKRNLYKIKNIKNLILL